jgi:hypothetical protein
MKRIFVSLLLFLLFSALVAQTDAEKRILGELNLYRSRLGLSSFAYDKSLSEVAKHHATYLSMCTQREIWLKDHEESYDFPQWNELSYEQRVSEADKKSGVKIKSEVQCQGGGDDEKMIIKDFDSSLPHQKILRTKSSSGTIYVGIGNVNGNTVIVFGLYSS